MTGLPTLTVLLDDGTGAFPYDITQYAQIAPGFSYNRGRGDWQGAVTGSALSELTLNNSTGRFTVGSTLIASPSPIRVDQRIRIKETINGTTFTRGTWYVKSWPVTWPATVATIAMAPVGGSDAQARAERRTLLSVVEEEILADSPGSYYTLGEPAGSVTASDTSGNQSAALALAGGGATVVFGTGVGPGTDGLSAATFTGGMYLADSSGRTYLWAPLFSTPTAFTIAFLTSASGAVMSLVGSTNGSPILGIDATGHLTTGFAGGLASTATVNDDATHVATVTYATGGGTNIRLYLDGVLVASGSDAGGVSGTLSIGNGFTGTLAHFVSMTISSSVRIAAYATAMLTGFAGESGTARITRLAGYAALPIGALNTSLTNVPFVDFTGSSAWDAIQQVVDAEFGVVFVDESGNLEFHNRTKVSLKTTPDLTLVASQYIAPDVQPVDDDQQILNYLETTSSVTGVTQVVRNTLSELGNGTVTNPGHGRYPDSRTYLVSTDAEALDRANWIVANFAEPTTRYGTLTINLYAAPPAVAAQILTALDLDCWIRVTSMPAQNTTGTTADVVVQGYTETLNATTWQIVCNVVSRSLYNVAIYDDPVYGIYDNAKARFGV